MAIVTLHSIHKSILHLLCQIVSSAIYMALVRYLLIEKGQCIQRNGNQLLAGVMKLALRLHVLVRMIISY